jgi:hypothetical protein
MPRGVPRNRPQTVVEKPEAPVSARATEMRRERRRRQDGDLDASARLKLAIPPEVKEKLAREGLTPRWVRDDPGRIQQLQAEDWDPVPGVQSVAASRTDPGQMVLMAKREDWYHEDRKPLSETNKANEKAAMRGDAPPGEGVSTDGFYAPQGTANRISRGA